METRRSTRLSSKTNAKNSNAFNAKNSIDTERDGSISPVPSKKLKSSYFDPDFSEESDNGSDQQSQKRKAKSKIKSNKKTVQKSRYESDSESSSNEFVQKPKSLKEILQNNSELQLSDESDSSDDSLPKKKKKLDGSPMKKKTPKKQFDSDSDKSVETNEPAGTKNGSKSELLDDVLEGEKSDSKVEYFDFTALVNKVKANNETNITAGSVETKLEPSYEEPQKKPQKSKLVKKSKKVTPKTEPETEKSNLEVFELLAMGEDTDLSAKDIKESVAQSSQENYEIPKQVEVLLDAPVLKKKKTTDLEMTLRRRLNFIRRENQVYIHKVHILCWISHGMHVNSVLNSPELLSLALSLLPSDKCYPSKRMDMNYLNQLIEWFAKKIKIKKEPLEDTKTKLFISLQSQFQKQEADNKRDLCFMFICIIRALGIKCRLIINLNVVPLKPTSDQLLPINAKKDDTAQPSCSKSLKKEKSEDESKKSKKSEESSSRSPRKSSKETPTKEQSTTKRNELSSRSQNERSKSVSERSSRSKSEKSKNENEKSKLPSEKNERSKPQSEKNERSSRSKSEKSKTDTNQRSSRSKKSSEELSQSDQTKDEAVELRRSARSKSTDTKKQSEYFKEEKSLRSKRINTKSSYFPKNSDKKKKESVKSKSKTRDKKEEPLVEEMSTSDDSDDDEQTFVPLKKKKIDRRVLSSEEDIIEEKNDAKNKPNKMNYWLEVFLEAEEQWICVDISKKGYHCIQQLYNAAAHPVRYIVAFNSDQTIKDVTRRYVPQYLSVTRKLRVDDNWWKATLSPFKPPQNAQNQEEDEALDRVLEEQPLPTAISEYKNHPLYALKRHLLKFQAIYPPDAPPLGFVKGEPVYSRLCVQQIHGREMWIKEAKVVKMGEKPYKIVKGRQKKDKFGSNEAPKDLELFGLWQTEDYDPPVAKNGIVPRNSFGNVELFKPCMLPKGTVYLQIPGLQRIANKLNIDCAAAITGFEYSTNGWSYPVKDGFVVCEEYKDILLDAYNQEVEEAEKKEKQKREERVYANWKRLIKGLCIRERLKRKYNFGDPSTSSEKDKSSTK